MSLKGDSVGRGNLLQGDHFTLELIQLLHLLHLDLLRLDLILRKFA